MNTKKIAKYLTERPVTGHLTCLRSHDLASLIAGVKTVVYTSITGREEERVLDRMCSDLKFEKMPLENTQAALMHGFTGVNILIATDARRMRRLAKCYAGTASPYECGMALDYPECCSNAFADWSGSLKRGDLIKHTVRNSPPEGPVSFILNNIWNWHSRLSPKTDSAALKTFSKLNRGFDMDSILPWHPCSYSCAASLAAGSRIYEVLSRYMPNVTAARRKILSNPVIYWDKFNFAVLDGECRRLNKGFSAEYTKIGKPKALLAAGTAGMLNTAAPLRFSASGKVTGSGAPHLPAGYVFLPFSSGITGTAPGSDHGDRDLKA